MCMSVKQPSAVAVATVVVHTFLAAQVEKTLSSFGEEPDIIFFYCVPSI